jgi:hypothetical protein
MKRTKYLLPFFLIALICIISFRFFFFVSYIRLQKTDFRQQLFLSGSRELVRFEFSENELFHDTKGFEWKKQNKELVVQGVYHEVIKVVLSGKKAIVFAIPDKEENSLFQSYFGLQKNIQDNGPDLVKLLLNLSYLESRFDFSARCQITPFKPLVSKIIFHSDHFRLKSIKPPEPGFYI